MLRYVRTRHPRRPRSRTKCGQKESLDEIDELVRQGLDVPCLCSADAIRNLTRHDVFERRLACRRNSGKTSTPEQPACSGDLALSPHQSRVGVSAAASTTGALLPIFVSNASHAVTGHGTQ